jgi:mediator of RNA polymerase II transcription subunit 17
MDNTSDSNPSFTLPLRPLVEKDADVNRKKKDTLPIRIAQINAQRGSFRNVTEQSLQEEINTRRERRRRGEDEEEEEENVEAKKSAELDTTERHEMLYKRRAEIMQFAVYAPS